MRSPSHATPSPAASAGADTFGRVVDYLRISITDRCNERCLYCMPEGYPGWARRPDDLTAEEISNRHEAEAAMAKAHDLISKYNLDLLREEKEKEFISLLVGRPALRHFIEDYALANFLQDFYFIRCIWVPAYVPEKGKMGRALEISGTIPNVRIAGYVHDYVRRFIAKEWKEYNSDGALTRYRLTDFAQGIIEGFRSKLISQEEGMGKDRESYALIKKEDPFLKKYIAYRYPHTATIKTGRGSRDPGVRRDGKAFGRAQQAIDNAGSGLAAQAKARAIALLAGNFPGDPTAELNLVPVDRVVAGILAALCVVEAIGNRIHLATDNRIRVEDIAGLSHEELGVKVRLADPTLFRNLTMSVVKSILLRAGEPKQATALERLSAIFSGYGEWGQPVHEIGNDVRILGLPTRRPDTLHASRMLCRHNKYVQDFGNVRDPDEIAAREAVWDQALAAIELRTGLEAGALGAGAFRRLVAQEIDLKWSSCRPVPAGSGP